MAMKKIFVLGTTEYSFMISSMIEQEKQYEIVGHTCSKQDIEKNKSDCEKHSRKLFAFEELNEIQESEVNILNAIGYSSMNRTRQRMSEECKKSGYIEVGFISNRATVLTNDIGIGNIIFPQAYVGTNVRIGKNNVVYAGVVLTHDIYVGDYNFIAAGATIGGVVRIEDNCFIGMNATIKNKIMLSNYSLVGAGAYVAKTTKENAVIVPEKSIELDKNSFEIKI